MEKNNPTQKAIEKRIFPDFLDFLDYLDAIKDIKNIKPIFSFLGERECMYLVLEDYLCDLEIGAFITYFNNRLDMVKDTGNNINEWLIYLLACAKRYMVNPNVLLKEKIDDLSRKLIKSGNLNEENEIKEYIEYELFKLLLKKPKIFQLVEVKNLFIQRYLNVLDSIVLTLLHLGEGTYNKCLFGHMIESELRKVLLIKDLLRIIPHYLKSLDTGLKIKTIDYFSFKVVKSPIYNSLTLEQKKSIYIPINKNNKISKLKEDCIRELNFTDDQKRIAKYIRLNFWLVVGKFINYKEVIILLKQN